MGDLDRRARIAGGLYLLSLPIGFFSLMFVPSHFIASNDPGATVARILAAEGLFRLGVVSELAGAVLWIFVMRALYRLFVEVDRGQAWLMLVLSLMAVPIMILDVLSELAALALLHEPRIAAAFSPAQTQALVGLLLRSHGQGLTVAGIFWGLWLFPVGVLIWRSGFLPKALAVLAVVGGAGYLASSLTLLLAPAYIDVVDPAARIATAAGEIPLMFWLVLAGARRGWRA
jgi:hypothetical protein